MVQTVTTPHTIMAQANFVKRSQSATRMTKRYLLQHKPRLAVRPFASRALPVIETADIQRARYSRLGCTCWHRGPSPYLGLQHWRLQDRTVPEVLSIALQCTLPRETVRPTICARKWMDNNNGKMIRSVFHLTRLIILRSASETISWTLSLLISFIDSCSSIRDSLILSRIVSV